MMNNIKNQDFVVIGNINVDFVQLLFVYEILINMICATYYHNFNSWRSGGGVPFYRLMAFDYLKLEIL
jgi:hypothetical protein